LAPLHDLEQHVQPPRVLTIGHSNHAAEDFVALLRQHDITTLIDVRSEPYSRHVSHFCRAPLEACLASASIVYHWMGDTLGGRPADPACYHDGIVRKGNVDYRALTQHPRYRAGVQELIARASTDHMAIMCSEEDPRRCHRHLLIEPSLREQHVEVLHIRRDGSCEAIQKQDITTLSKPDPQLTLKWVIGDGVMG
jgi:uncharacterized protein (DUF488 family)